MAKPTEKFTAPLSIHPIRLNGTHVYCIKDSAGLTYHHSDKLFRSTPLKNINTYAYRDMYLATTVKASLQDKDLQELTEKLQAAVTGYKVTDVLKALERCTDTSWVIPTDYALDQAVIERLIDQGHVIIGPMGVMQEMDFKEYITKNELPIIQYDY